MAPRPRGELPRPNSYAYTHIHTYIHVCGGGGGGGVYEGAAQERRREERRYLLAERASLVVFCPVFDTNHAEFVFFFVSCAASGRAGHDGHAAVSPYWIQAYRTRLCFGLQTFPSSSPSSSSYPPSSCVFRLDFGLDFCASSFAARWQRAARSANWGRGGRENGR